MRRPPSDFSRLLTTETSSLVSTVFIRLSRLVSLRMGTSPSPSPTVMRWTGTPGADPGDLLLLGLEQLRDPGRGALADEDDPGAAEGTEDDGRAAEVGRPSSRASRRRRPAPGSCASRGCRGSAGRRPAAPGWPSRAAYIALLPRWFMTSVAASGAGGQGEDEGVDGWPSGQPIPTMTSDRQRRPSRPSTSRAAGRAAGSRGSPRGPGRCGPSSSRLSSDTAMALLVRGWVSVRRGVGGAGTRPPA